MIAAMLKVSEEKQTIADSLVDAVQPERYAYIVDARPHKCSAKTTGMCVLIRGHSVCPPFGAQVVFCRQAGASKS